jgi:hypothetical protein
MSSARHLQIDGLTERVNETMRILLRCYRTKSRFDKVSQLPMVLLYCNCSINEASTYFPIEMSYGFQPATLTDIL